MFINQYAAVNLDGAARDRLHIGPHTDGHHHQVGIQLGSAAQRDAGDVPRLAVDAAHGVLAADIDPGPLHGSFRHVRGRPVEGGAQNAVGQLHHGDVQPHLDQRLGGFESDEPGAHDDGAADAVRVAVFADLAGVVPGGEGEHAFRVRALQIRGHDGRAARGDQQAVVGHLVAVGGLDNLPLRIQSHGPDAEHRLGIVPLVEIIVAVGHVLVVNLAAQPVGDERPGVGVVRFLRQHCDVAMGVMLADGLHGADAGRRVADDGVPGLLTHRLLRYLPDK